jgi:hypothetical protein
MIGTETDMSYIVAIANLMVIVVLLPTLMNKRSFIPRSTSIPTSVALLMFSFVFLNQGLIIGASMEILSSLLWIFISIKRGNIKINYSKTA